MSQLKSIIPPQFWKSFGPGLMWAAAAIGVSHLHQSTRAGASAGFALAGIVLLAIILKYPFFEYGPRYAAATGQSLVEGYKRIGSWALWLYFILTLFTSVIVQVAIILFTGFLLQYALGLSMPQWVSGGVVYLACAAVLWAGRFRVFDLVVKAILVLLAVSTLVAAGVTVPRADLSTLAIWPAIGDGGVASLAFILALVGWMPSAIDVSVWSSLWTLAKNRDSGVRASVKASQLDFGIGYWGTGILAFAFLLLGATVMFGAGQEFSPQGTVFSTQLVELYTTTLGAWTRPMVLVAVLTTMLSTSITVVDGFPRALDRCVQVFRLPEGQLPEPDAPVGRGYWIAILVLGVVNPLVLAVFIGGLATMVDFATIFAFITAPVLGYLNLRAVTSDDVPPEHRPGPKMLALSYVGLILLGGTAVVYVVSRLM
jgi:Mn2+/Fe2+ NRAMP family transporter